MSDLTQDERKHLCWSLLRGLANECQDRLCAADEQHAWGPWVRYVVQPDKPIGLPSREATVCEEFYRVAARQTCENCGKERFSG